MKSALKATALLGSSSLLTIILGLVTAKIWARLIGPAGYGHIGLLQGTVSILMMLTELGLSTAIVRHTGAPIARGDRAEVLAIWRSATLISLPILVFTGIAMLLFHEPLGSFLLGQRQGGTDLLCLFITVWFGVATSVRTALINAYQKVKLLAAINIGLNLMGTVVMLSFVFPLGIRGIAPGLAVGAFARWLVVSVALWKATGLLLPPLKATARFGRELLRSCIPMAASVLVGPGVQYFLPAIILHLADKNAVGFYQAANSIVFTLISFLLTATGQDYFPRVSAAGSDSGVLRSLAHQQQRLLLLLGLPLLFGIKWGVSWALPYVLSGEFSRIQDIIDWHLPGELLRFSSVNFAFIVLARASGVAFFVPALVNGVVMLVGTLIFVPILGVRGIGLAFSLSHLVYLVVVVWQVRTRFSWGLGTDTWLLAVGLLGLILPNFIGKGHTVLQFTVELLLAGGATLYSAYRIRREWVEAR